jgi:hypothetical protein
MSDLSESLQVQVGLVIFGYVFAFYHVCYIFAFDNVCCYQSPLALHLLSNTRSLFLSSCLTFTAQVSSARYMYLLRPHPLFVDTLGVTLLEQM